MQKGNWDKQLEYEKGERKKQLCDEIVKKAVDYKLGARGLRSICESILLDDMFNLPGSSIKKLVVDKNYIEPKLSKIKLSKLREAS